MGSAADGPWAGADRWQALLNEREIPPSSRQRRLTAPIPVRARLVWERDGEEIIETMATHWAGRAVLVRTSDRRRRFHGVWLDSTDVQRLSHKVES
ncbi:hypothetical protein [Cellulomonas gilvus]|uniref:Uncharacterized protein n=1 Tax=Cellulomonas gilvus (strain ATCC 13127 / NRRL B-14078) TaxID=593907 RepID=F8A2E2_CELGA|nr:hypothetical protein [Cellulomonas gilvus]AEI11799.1 hypothetical protein Celgi_1280 [Cellulomonas gilvus ATCC 13127]